MDNIDFFNIIAGIASIVSLGISIYAISQVKSIKRETKAKGKVSFKAKGSDSKQAFGDIIEGKK